MSTSPVPIAPARVDKISLAVKTSPAVGASRPCEAHRRSRLVKAYDVVKLFALGSEAQQSRGFPMHWQSDLFRTWFVLSILIVAGCALVAMRATLEQDPTAPALLICAGVALALALLVLLNAAVWLACRWSGARKLPSEYNKAFLPALAGLSIGCGHALFSGSGDVISRIAEIHLHAASWWLALATVAVLLIATFWKRLAL